MKRMLFFARRNALEILRDPISLFFGIVFPVILLLLLTLIDRAIPAEAAMNLYEIKTLAPGISAFGLCFLALFSATLISKDRCSSFMLRLRTSPLSPWQYIAGYCLPMIPMAAVQCTVCAAASLMLGLKFSGGVFAMILGLMPTACVYIGAGLLLGSILPEKAVGGICGALLTNLAGWLSGTWFSVEMIGGAFETICKILPFYPSACAARALLQGDWSGAATHLLIVSLWALAIFAAAVAVFNTKMRSDRA